MKDLLNNINTDTKIVMSIAKSLLYDGLDEDTAISLINSLTERQAKILIAALIKAFEKYRGIRI